MDETSGAVGDYLAAMSLELADMAARQGFDTAAYLFRMAHASFQASEDNTPSVRPTRDAANLR